MDTNNLLYLLTQQNRLKVNQIHLHFARKPQINAYLFRENKIKRKYHANRSLFLRPNR